MTDAQRIEQERVDAEKLAAKQKSESEAEIKASDPKTLVQQD